MLLLDYGDEGRSDKDPVFTVVSTQDIKTDDPSCIFLIDHQITFKLDSIRKDLDENPSIVHRLSAMMGLPENNDVDKVLEHVWKYCNFYTINAQGENFKNLTVIF